MKDNKKNVRRNKRDRVHDPIGTPIKIYMRGSEAGLRQTVGVSNTWLLSSHKGYMRKSFIVAMLRDMQVKSRCRLRSLMPSMGSPCNRPSDFRYIYDRAALNPFNEDPQIHREPYNLMTLGADPAEWRHCPGFKDIT